MNKKTSTLLMGLLCLAGCAQEPAHVQPPTPIEVSISEAADSINTNLVRLAAIEQAGRKSVDVSAETVKSPALNRRISVAWNGGIDPLVGKICQNAGFQFRITGRKPAVPVMVAIDAKNERMADVLRNIGLQAGAAADVLIFEQSKVIEVHYAG